MGPDHLIAYNRADHDGYRWWNKWFPQRGTDGNQYMVQEMNKFSAYIFGGTAWPGHFRHSRNLERIMEQSHLKTRNTLYCEGTYCNFHVKLINRKRSYNVYIYVYRNRRVNKKNGQEAAGTYDILEASVPFLIRRGYGMRAILTEISG